MNENILKVLNSKADFYTHNLEQKFPLILDKIILMWDLPEFDSYLNTLMLDKRDRQRQGFPPEVASEILRISILHTEQFGKTESGSWIDSSDVRIN